MYNIKVLTKEHLSCGCGSMVELRLPKPAAGVRFPSSAPKVRHRWVSYFYIQYGTNSFLAFYTFCSIFPVTFHSSIIGHKKGINLEIDKKYLKFPILFMRLYGIYEIIVEVSHSNFSKSYHSQCIDYE